MNVSKDVQALLHARDISALEEKLRTQPGLGPVELDAALNYSVCNASADVAGTLLRHGARIKHITFINAIKRGEVAFFEEFINHDWNIDSTQFGAPAVQLALGNDDLLRWLLDHGANPNTSSKKLPGGMRRVATPLATAAAMPGTSGLNILLSYDAELDPKALFRSIGTRDTGHLAHMRILIDHGVDIDYWTQQWGTPLHHAVRNGCKEMVQLLVESGADSSIRDWLDKTPLEVAVERNDKELCKILEREK